MNCFPTFTTPEKKGMKSSLHLDNILKADLKLEAKEKLKYKPECVFCNYPKKKVTKISKNKKKKK